MSDDDKTEKLGKCPSCGAPTKPVKYLHVEKVGHSKIKFPEVIREFCPRCGVNLSGEELDAYERTAAMRILIEGQRITAVVRRYIARALLWADFIARGK